MTIDRRPIFTVGMVWTEFVHRIPRTCPRYRREPMQYNLDSLYSLQQYALQQQNLTAEQRAALAQQQLGASYNGLAQYAQYGWPFKL